MRSNSFFISGLVALALLAIPVAVTAESDTITCVAGEYELEQVGDGIYAVKMADAGYLNMYSPGDPSLPQKVIDIRVPVDLDLSDLTLTVENVETTLLGTYEIIPQAPPLCDSTQQWGMDKVIVDGKNIKVYGQNAVFPQQYVELLPYLTNLERDAASGTVKMLKRIRFVFTPFQYNPVDQTLILVSEATVIVNYNNREESNFTPAPKSVMDPLAVKDYVIITTDAIVSNSDKLADFVDMKEFQGRTVKIVTKKDFDGLTGDAPNGRAEKIREWLKINQPALGIKDVLLIGNPDPDDPTDPTDFVGDIPMKLCFPDFYYYEDRDCPTDWFYADLLGDWDVDNDEIYGVELSSTNEKKPKPNIDPTTFSIIWEGKLRCDNINPEDYSFWAFSDDGVELSIDGVKVIDNMTDHYPTLDKVTVNLTNGMHDFKLRYYQNAGQAVIRLYWHNSTYAQPRQMIPSDHLYYSDGATPPNYTPGFLNVTYYNDMDFTDLKYTGLEDWIFGVWSTGDNDPATERKTASQVFVGRIPVYGTTSADYADLDDILEKTILYESADPASIGWRKSMLLPMKPSDASTPAYDLGEAIRNDFALANNFTCSRIYEEDYPGVVDPALVLWPCTMNNVQWQWINNPDGRGMVTWWTHGGPTTAIDVFESGRAVNLNNARPSFTFQASCSNGYPETKDNLGYSLLRQGAITTVSASRTSLYMSGITTNHDAPADSRNQFISYAYTKHVIDAGKSAGEAQCAFKADLMHVDKNVMDYNLYGDPDCFLLKTFYNQPPTADAGGPYSVNLGGTVTLDASGSSDPEGSLLRYRWDIDNDGTYDSWSSSPYLSFQALVPGTITIPLQVKDAGGMTATATAQVTVQYEFNFTVTPNPVPPNTPVTVSYTIPSSYVNAIVKIVEHHQWYTMYRTEFNQVPLSGTAGDHSYSPVWFWNKWYFGSTSGPYLIELMVNGTIVESLQLSFTY